MPYHSSRCRVCLLAVSLFLVLFLPGTGFAQSQSTAQVAPSSKWNDAVATLAGKIAGISDASQPASLNVNNISSLDSLAVSAIESTLQTELSQHLRLAPAAEAKTQIIVTLSEGATGYVWVAQVRSGNSEQTAMVSIPKEAPAAASRERAAISLQRKLIWSQPEPFLDFALPDGVPANGPGMVVLEPSSVVFYSSVEGHWVAGKSVALNANGTRTRDPRGMIWQTGDEIDLFVPGESCSGMVSALPNLLCVPYASTNSTMTWPLATGEAQGEYAQFESNRNFFDGTVSVDAMGTSQTSLPPFYAAAAKSTSAGLDWVIAGLDGKARLYDAGKLIATFSGWGDQVATIDSECNDSWQVLTTGAGDSSQPDHIQIYDIRNYLQAQASAHPAASAAQTALEATAAGQPLDFSGPILALWSSADLKSARVVSLNLQTGMYEGSIISVSCGE